MASKQIAVTLTYEEVEFLSQKNLSPTQLLKEKIHEIADLTAHSELAFKEARQKIERLAETLDKQRVFIEKEGLIDKFLKELEL